MAEAPCIKLVQQAIDLLATTTVWEDEAALVAQDLGLQGEKRIERMEARNDFALIQKYRHRIFGLLDVKLKRPNPAVNLPSMTTIEEYFEAYIKKLWATYDELHEIANALVQAKYQPLAQPLYCYVTCVEEDIVAAKRLLKEYRLAGKEYHHISRYEVGYCNRHDEAEKMERSEGFIA